MPHFDELAAAADEVAAPSAPSGTAGTRTWAFVTNHLAVLVCVAADPEMRVSDIARAAGITERAAQGILHDLVASGYVERKRVGRRNHYDVQRSKPLRRPLFKMVAVGDLLDLVLPPQPGD